MGKPGPRQASGLIQQNNSPVDGILTDLVPAPGMIAVRMLGPRFWLSGLNEPVRSGKRVQKRG